MPRPPPSSASMSRIRSLSPTMSPISEASQPNSTLRTAKPATQPSSVPLCRRTARANGVRSRGAAVAGPSGVGSSPNPTSLRRCNRQAVTARAAVTTTGMSNTQNRSPANGRTRVAQPSGDNHDNREASADESPTARTANAIPSTAPARPLAVLEYSASCAVTAATPVNTHATDVNPRPNANAPDADVPAAINAAAVASPVSAANAAHTTDDA